MASSIALTPPLRLQQELPGETGDDLGEHVGHEDQQPEDARGRASCG